MPLNTLRIGSLSPPASSLPTPSPLDAFSGFPPPIQAERLFSVFFNRLHTRWPILDRKQYERVFERQYEQGAVSIVEKSMLHLVYAVSARFMQLTKQSCDVDHEVRQHHEHYLRVS